MKTSKATFVFGQMNEPPGARARVALSGLTLAEYFRDGEGDGQGKDILFFVDNIFRFTQACLRETEDVINEEKDVFTLTVAFTVTEVLCQCQT